MHAFLPPEFPLKMLLSIDTKNIYNPLNEILMADFAIPIAKITLI